MQRIGRNIVPDIQTVNYLPALTILEKVKKRYFDYLIKRCNKIAEEYGKSNAGLDQLLWNAAVSKRASYYYQIQAIYLKADIREMKKNGQ